MTFLWTFNTKAGVTGGAAASMYFTTTAYLSGYTGVDTLNVCAADGAFSSGLCYT